MRSIVVRPCGAGWSVQTHCGGLLWFLSGAKAERSAYGLAGRIAGVEGVAQVIVRNDLGLTISSAVVGSATSRTPRLVNRD